MTFSHIAVVVLSFYGLCWVAIGMTAPAAGKAPPRPIQPNREAWLRHYREREAERTRWNALSRLQKLREFWHDLRGIR